MSDLLIKLYDLPPLAPILAEQQAQGIQIVRALPPDKRKVIMWIRDMFGGMWASECDVAFSRVPVGCYLALSDNTIVGFACHDATCKNFFGPTGVSDSYQKRGIGTALLLACLHTMHVQGYGYAIIGDASSNEYYQRSVGAIVIEGSSPGIYRHMLR